MGNNLQPVEVRRVRRVSVGGNQQIVPPEVPPEGQYRGFGSVRGETLEEFHERMFDLPALEAMIYEMEVALECHN